MAEKVMSTSTKQETSISTAFTISDFYQLLSLSLGWPSDKLVMAVLDGSYKQDGLNILEELSCSRQELSQMGAAFHKLEQDADDATALLKEMRREYTRLFSHPQQPSINIYESVYTGDDNGKKQETVLFSNFICRDVERCYKEAGLINKSGEPADHMVTELEFMMYLYKVKGDALQEQDKDAIKKVEGQIRNFEVNHFAKWGREFFNSMEVNSEVQFYKTVGKLAGIGLKQVLVKSNTGEHLH